MFGAVEAHPTARRAARGVPLGGEPDFGAPAADVGMWGVLRCRADRGDSMDTHGPCV
jgi:hypothetical protein